MMRSEMERQEEMLEDSLFSLSMQKKWYEVADLYEKHPEAGGVILTNSRETALHVAVSSYSAKAAHHIKIMIQNY